MPCAQSRLNRNRLLGGECGFPKLGSGHSLQGPVAKLTGARLQEIAEVTAPLQLE
jgi:hypothetical protein